MRIYALKLMSTYTQGINVQDILKLKVTANHVDMFLCDPTEYRAVRCHQHRFRGEYDDSPTDAQNQGNYYAVNTNEKFNKKIPGYVRSQSRKDQSMLFCSALPLLSQDGYETGGSTQNPRKSILSIRASAYELKQGSSFSTGVEVQDKRRRVLTISTGSKSVDGILGGEQI